MKEFTIQAIPNTTFRIKEMNGIEALASRQVLINASKNDLQVAYDTMLEKYIDVQVDKDSWIRCKQKNNFYPVGLENNIPALVEIMNEFVEYVKSFFEKSNA